MNYDDWTGKLHIHLQPGLQRLGGKQAESYLRFRHDEIGSDVARVQRQQGFLMEVGKQLLRPAVILRLPDLWSIVQTHARTNIPPGELIRIARWARHLDIHKDVTMSVLPGDYRTIKGLSYWVPDVDAISPYLDAHFRGRPSGLAGRQTSPRVVIWDATGRHPSLKALQRQLREAGYLVWAVDRRKKSQPATRVIVQRGDAEGGNRLAGTLGMDDVFPAAVGDLNSDFTIELGRDWTGDQAADSRAAAGDGG